MKKQFTKRILSWFLAAVMALGMVAPMGAANTSDAAKTKETELIVEKVDNDAVSVALGDKITDEATDEEPAADEVVRVSIILKDAATTAKFSTEDIAKNKEAIQYRAALAEKQESMAQKISKEVLGGQDLDIVWNLTLAANLISANVAYGDVAAIEKIPGVQEVVLETRYEPMVVKTEDKADPNTATSGVMTGTFSAYAEGYTGAGSRVAIIDTGIDTDHQSFDNDAFLYSLKEGGYNVDELNLLDVEEIASVLAELNASEKYAGLTAEDLYRNEKEPYNFNYIDKNLDVQHIQSDEHGAHVAGIAAANAYIPDGKGGFVSALDSVKVQGAAPDAQILTMRVFGQGGGAYDSDYMAAIEDAVILGCDSVNLSLGSGNPGFSRSATAAYAKIMDDLQDSGTVVTMSAGNSGYWAEKASPVGYLYAEDVSMQMDGSPGSYDNSLAVASADNIGFTGSYLTVDGSNVFYTETSYTNKPITTIGGDHEFVYVDGNGTDADFAAVADKLAGKIALCNRGSISFYEKAENAVKHGAIATIVVNNQAGTINMDLSDYTKTAPVISITQADGALVKDAAASEETIGGNTVYFGTLTVGSDVGSAITADHVTMSSFSSWGVPGSLTLKPEITAPGGSIYSVNGAIAGGTSYETMSGTSMAAPQIAGITALMAQYVRDNDLVAKTGLDQRTLIQSLLMSTAEPLFDNDNEGAYYYPVLQQGAGLVNVGAAVKAESYILMDESSTDSAADGKVKAELGD
ncbi:MAG: S8 family serine peptidase, partial [Clostridiales bacterium]|nr:S8 family serine peptidase [Clostridiales bacterium]